MSGIFRRRSDIPYRVRQPFILTVLAAVTGTIAVTLSAFTSSGAGLTPATGTAANTLDGFTSSASGLVVVTGTGANTLDAFTSSSSGLVGTVSGSAANTMAAFTSSASGSITTTGTAVNTLAAFTSSGSGSLGASGTSATTLANFTSSASGWLEARGTASNTMEAFTSSGSGGIDLSLTTDYKVAYMIEINRTTGTNTKSILFRTRVNLMWVHVEYVSSATAGNRAVVLELLDSSSNIVLDTHSTVNQAASLTRHYEFFPGTYREGAFGTPGGDIQLPLPDGLIILPNYTIRIRDTQNISASDAMTIGYGTKPV